MDKVDGKDRWGENVLGRQIWPLITHSLNKFGLSALYPRHRESITSVNSLEPVTGPGGPTRASLLCDHSITCNCPETISEAAGVWLKAIAKVELDSILF